MGIDHKRIVRDRDGRRAGGRTIAALYLGSRANFDPTIGPGRLIFAFEAVIIGGLGSLWGTLAGGVIHGRRADVGASINPEWQLLAGPYRLSRRARFRATRPVSAHRGLSEVADGDGDELNDPVPYRIETGTLARRGRWRSRVSHCCWRWTPLPPLPVAG